jgi:hypothetical protein
MRSIYAYALDHNDQLPEGLSELRGAYVEGSLLDKMNNKADMIYFANEKIERLGAANEEEPIIIFRTHKEGRYYVGKANGSVEQIGAKTLKSILREYEIPMKVE